MHCDTVYKNLVEDILENGSWRNTRSGRCLSTFGKFVEFDLREGFPLLTTKKMAIRAMVGELLWFINGETTIEELKYRTFGDKDIDKWTIWTEDFNRFAQTEQYENYYQENKHSVDPIMNLGPVYGKQWYHQLRDVVERIKDNPTDRRLLVNSWNVDELEQMALPPCHYAFQFYVDGDYIDVMWHQRSVDVGLGLAFNISSYAMLLHIVASITNKKPRYVKASLGDVHLYENSIDAVKLQISREPLPLMQYKLPFKIASFEDLDSVTTDDFMHSFKNYVSHEAIKIDVCVG